MSPRPLRVVYVVGYYADLTGSQRSLLALLEALPPEEVDPLVVFPGEGRCTAAYRDAGIRVEVLQAPPALDRFGGVIPAASRASQALLVGRDLVPYAVRFARLLARERADIAHFNDLRALLLCGPGAVLRPTLRVWHVRGDGSSLGAAHLAGAALADGILCVADAVQRTLPGWAQPRCRTVHNGIEADERAHDEAAETAAAESPSPRSRDALLGEAAPPAACSGEDDGALLVLMVGTLVPFKGAHHLLEAARLLEVGAPNLALRVRLVLLGDAPEPAYRAQLATQAAALRQVRVHFAGWDPKPMEWMRAADVVVLPTVADEVLVIDGVEERVSGSEGFPRTVLEAMVCARPVIATRVMGVPEQVEHGVTGLLCPPSDPGALVRALAAVLGMTGEERARIGAAGRARVVERFSIRSNVDGTLAFYRELVSRR